MTQILDQHVQQFLDELASSAPTPGGGSVAALTGAMAAGLLTMVCDLTVGKKTYAEFEDEAKTLRERAEAGRTALQRLAQEDIDVFGRLGAAYKLPRTTDADAASRRAAIQMVTRAGDRGAAAHGAGAGRSGAALRAAGPPWQPPGR